LARTDSKEVQLRHINCGETLALSGTLKIKLLRLLVRLFAVLPLPLLQLFGRLVGSCAWHAKGRSARTTERNIELCFPEMDSQAQQALVKSSLQETAKNLFEMGKAWLAPVDKTLALIKNVNEELDMNDALAKGKGVIIVAPHLGNWEILNLYVGHRFPLNILYQPPKLAELDDFIRGARARVGANVFPTNRRGVMAMFKALRDGEVVGILPDQEPPEEASAYVPFFGIDAMSMTLVSKLVQKTEATVVCGYAKRLPNGQGYEVVIKAADPEIYSADLNTSVAALNRSVEQCVADAPAQYQWEYKRFKTMPGGDNKKLYD